MKHGAAVLAVILLSGGAAALAAQESGAASDAASAPTAASASDASAPAVSAVSVSTQAGQGQPLQVVIKGGGAESKIGAQKPPLKLQVDPFATIRKDLEPDPSLLLAVSPLTVSWRKTHPDFLDDPRVVQVWRTNFGHGPGIVFHVQNELFRALQQKIPADELKGYSWSLTVADEGGRVFYRSAGEGDPPADLLWSGENDRGEWIQAGHSYSAVYTFRDPSGSPYTIAGDPILFHGVVHQEDSGLFISLDSALIFGQAKSDAQVAEPAGQELLRQTADFIKRKLFGIPISVRVFAVNQETGTAQAGAVEGYLQHELMVPPQNFSVDAAAAPFSQQRVEIVVLNR